MQFIQRVDQKGQKKGVEQSRVGSSQYDLPGEQQSVNMWQLGWK